MGLRMTMVAVVVGTMTLAGPVPSSGANPVRVAVPSARVDTSVDQPAAPAVPVRTGLTRDRRECPAKFVPQTGATFNVPSGTRRQKYAIQNAIIRLIECTQPRNRDGSRATIRAAFVSLTIPAVRRALVDAAARGVHVKVLSASHADEFRQWRKLALALGGNLKAANFAVTCRRGCLSPRTPPPAGSPTAWYRISPKSGAGRTFTFRDESSPGADAITGWSWAFGDGETSNSRGPIVKTYAKDGSYRTSLTVTDKQGRTHTTVYPVAVPDSLEEGTPALHSKVFLFSNVGIGRNQRTGVLLHTSANPTYAQSRSGFNSAYTVVGDKVMYAALVNYHRDLTRGAAGKLLTPNYFRSVRSPGSATAPRERAYFYPKSRPSGVGGDDLRQVLQQVQCTYREGGRTKRTSVRLSIAILSRRGLAEDLWQMAYAPPDHGGGCRVEILYSAMTQRLRDPRTGVYATPEWGVADCLSTPPVTPLGGYNTLDDPVEGRCGGGSLGGLPPSPAGGPFWWHKSSRLSGGRLAVGVSCQVALHRDPNGHTSVRCAQSSPIFTHNKVVMIDGMVDGKVQKVVVTGSANFTRAALRSNDEVMFRIHAVRVYNAFRANYDLLRKIVISKSRTWSSPAAAPLTYDAQVDPTNGVPLPYVQPGLPLDIAGLED
jgi:phosphatidylserine/phosphatidylglycerophosphate/cardiolipin synthase-like enzyme